MVEDPQQTLQDSDGNILARWYYDSDDNVVVRHEDSGEEMLLTEDGVEVDSLHAGGLDITPSTTFDPSNDSDTRSFDADDTTVDELADVLATLIRETGLDSS